MAHIPHFLEGFLGNLYHFGITQTSAQSYAREGTVALSTDFTKYNVPSGLEEFQKENINVVSTILNGKRKSQKMTKTFPSISRRPPHKLQSAIHHWGIHAHYTLVFKCKEMINTEFRLGSSMGQLWSDWVDVNAI